MIHGATIPRESWNRIAAETSTSVPSHTGIGTARAYASGRSQARAGTVAALLGNARLPQPLAELGREGIVGADADVGGGAGDLPDHRLAHRRPAGRLLERGRVQVGDVLERVLALGVGAGGDRHRGAALWARGELLER